MLHRNASAREATDDYLGERELLRPLQKLGGEMSGRVKAGKLDKHASKAVTAVVGKLAEFEERINDERVGTFRSRPDRGDSPPDW